MIVNQLLGRRQLVGMRRDQLEALFRGGTADAVPDGWGRGTAIFLPGSPFNAQLAELAEICAWKGKTFDAAGGRVINRVSPFGVNAIVADVYRAASWLDRAECVVLDYAKTSLVARWIRDEIRLVAPNVYLGLAYVFKQPLIYFELEFEASRRS